VLLTFKRRSHCGPSVTQSSNFSWHLLTGMQNTGEIRKTHNFCDYKLYCVKIKAALSIDAYNVVSSCHILLKWQNKCTDNSIQPNINSYVPCKLLALSPFIMDCKEQYLERKICKTVGSILHYQLNWQSTGVDAGV